MNEELEKDIEDYENAVEEINRDWKSNFELDPNERIEEEDEWDI